jgi:hypothetical protein
MCKNVFSWLRFASRFLAVIVLIPTMVLCQVAQPTQSMDRHGRKIQKALASYPAGSVVFVAMRDGSQSIGNLGALSATSFEVVEHSGGRLTLDYSAVDHVQKADLATGDRIVVRHHHGAVYYLVLTGVVLGLILVFAVEAGKS